MLRVMLKIIWIDFFWINSSYWVCVLLVRWCKTGAAYSRTGRIIAA